jgi:predicted nucleic-acid-binding protein
MTNESLDTNILLRYILKDDERQYKKAAKLFARKGIKYHVADLAILEFSQILAIKYDFSDAEIAEAISIILDMKFITTNENMLRPALHLFLENPKLSFADCCLATYAMLSDAEPLWTFDKKLARQTAAAKQP